MRIPNSFLSDLASDRSAFIVACRLYSLINPTTKISNNGYEICIKQETIAVSCNLSVSTVKRVLRRLADIGIITHSYRKTNAAGYLGTTHYSLQHYSLEYDYFNLPKNIFSRGLSPKLFYVYALFHKLKCNDIARFYQSYNDLAYMTKIKRSELCSCIEQLIKLKLIRKQLKHTRSGDYTDNTYFVIIYQAGKLYRKKRKVPCPFVAAVQGTHKKNKVCKIILSHKHNFVKTFLKKILKQRKRPKNFSYKGGG